MAKNIINMDGLFRAGYASAYDPSLDKSYQNTIIDKILFKAGEWAIDRYSENRKELKQLKAVGRKTNTAIQMEFEKLGAQLNPEIQKQLQGWKQEYDDAAKCGVKSWGAKRKEKCQAQMDMAFHKMTNFKKNLTAVEEEMATQVDKGFLELGEKATHGEMTKHNAGATIPEMTNAIRLATGSMLSNLQADPKTGDIYYLQQGEADRSEETYKKWSAEQVKLGAQDIPKYEDWAAVQEDEPLDPILFSRMAFPQDEDKTIQTNFTAITEQAERAGLDGRELDQQAIQRGELMINDKFEAATEAQIRSFMFGGQITVFDEQGNMTRVVPAHKMLIDGVFGKKFPPGKIDGTEEEQAQFKRFQGALEGLKEGDYGRVSEHKPRLVTMVSEASQNFHANGYRIYKKNHPESSSKNNPTGKDLLYLPNGTQVNRTVYNNYIKKHVTPTVNALNSEEKNIPAWNGPDRKGIRKVNGQYQTRNDKGEWANISRDGLAEMHGILDQMEQRDLSDDANLDVSGTNDEAANKDKKAKEELIKKIKAGGTSKYNIDFHTYNQLGTMSLERLQEIEKDKKLNLNPTIKDLPGMGTFKSAKSKK